MLSLDEMCNGKWWMENIKYNFHLEKLSFLLAKSFEFQKEGRMRPRYMCV